MNLKRFSLKSSLISLIAIIDKEPISKKVAADATHDLLEALLPQDARVIYNFHKALLRHGQRICVYKRPCCSKCPITDLCDYYKTVVKPQ